jgi:hypothetical protein
VVVVIVVAVSLIVDDYIVQDEELVFNSNGQIRIQTVEF